MGLLRLAGGAVVASAVLAATAAAQPSLHGALLPSSRTVATDAPATAFFTVLNSGDTTATNCPIQTSTPLGSSLDDFDIVNQRTDSAIGVGPLNPTFNIAPSEQIDFVVGVTRDAGSFLSDAFVDLYVDCDDDVFSLAWPMLTRFHVQFRDDAPDIIMIADTVSGDGIAGFGPGRGAVVAVAAVNIGAADAPTGGLASPQANEASIAARVQMPFRQNEFLYQASVCETDAAGVCLAPRTSCIVDGRDDCFTTQIGDTPVFFSFGIQAPPESGEAYDPVWRRLEPILASPTAFSRASFHCGPRGHRDDAGLRHARA
jgi:hypothetical protein